MSRWQQSDGVAVFVSPRERPLDLVGGERDLVDDVRRGQGQRAGPDLPQAYLGTAAPPGAWRKLLASLEKRLYDPADQAAAITSALAVFGRFEAAAREQIG